MLDLSKSHIETLIDFQNVLQCIKDAYIASSRGHVQTPDVMHLGFSDANGDCHIKAGHIKDADTFVVKIASGFYDNPKQGLPSSNGMMLAFSASTGAPTAILRDEGWLTDLRTGIGGAIATQALAAEDASDVLIIGTGIQASLQTRCLIKTCPNRDFKFTIWGRDNSAAITLAGALSKDNINATAAADLEQAVRTAQIIFTTTPSTRPLINDEWVQPGTLITAIGADSPGKQELPVELVQRAEHLVCDMASQSLSHGEFQHLAACSADSDVLELGNVLSGASAGRCSEKSIVIVDLTGIAAQDVAIAECVITAANSYYKTS